MHQPLPTLSYAWAKGGKQELIGLKYTAMCSAPLTQRIIVDNVHNFCWRHFYKHCVESRYSTKVFLGSHLLAIVSAKLFR